MVTIYPVTHIEIHSGIYGYFCSFTSVCSHPLINELFDRAPVGNDKPFEFPFSLRKAVRCVSDHLEEYDREQFARDMCVSSSTLYNKLRALTGQGISAFILSVRMREACRIARQNPDIRVNELGMAVGINTPKYFTRCFKEEIGMLPSEYIEKVKRREI